MLGYEMKSRLLELRDTSKTTRNVLTTRMLKDAADDISAALVTLTKCPSVEAMTTLNGAWAKGERVLQIAKAERTPDPAGGQSATATAERLAA
jgi:hypothetical protein